MGKTDYLYRVPVIIVNPSDLSDTDIRITVIDSKTKDKIFIPVDIRPGEAMTQHVSKENSLLIERVEKS